MDDLISKQAVIDCGKGGVRMEGGSVIESMCSFLNKHVDGVITIETDFLSSYSRPMMKIHLSVGDRNVCRLLSFNHVESELSDSIFKRIFENMCDTIDKMEE